MPSKTIEIDKLAMMNPPSHGKQTNMHIGIIWILSVSWHMFLMSSSFKVDSQDGLGIFVDANEKRTMVS